MGNVETSITSGQSNVNELLSYSYVHRPGLTTVVARRMRENMWML